MKKFILIIPLVGMLWTSCKKQDQLPTNQNSAQTGSKLKAKSARDGVWDVLGYGYDVTGEYANSNSTTYQVIDVARLYAADASRVITNLNTTQNSVFAFGQDAQDYSSSLSANLKATAGFSLFKGSITAAYSNSSSFSSKYIYGSYNLLMQQKELKFNGVPSYLQNYLTPTFVYDLTYLTPQQIVQQYGAFVLSDIMLGAKLEVTYQSETSSSDRKSAASAGLDASVGTVFSINASVNSNHAQSSSNFNQYLHFLTHGGDPTKSITSTTISFTPTTPTVDYGAWQASTNLQNAELVDIKYDGLISIDQLIPDPNLAQAVHNYIYNTYLPNNQVTVSYQSSVLYRCYNVNNDDHMLITNPGEVSGLSNWRIEGLFGHIYSDNSKPGVKPLRRFNLSNGYHFFTTDIYEYPSGAAFEGTVGYVDGSFVSGELPIYRYTRGGEHMYANTYNELYGGINGWIYEGIIGYIQP